MNKKMSDEKIEQYIAELEFMFNDRLKNKYKPISEIMDEHKEISHLFPIVIAYAIGDLNDTTHPDERVYLFHPKAFRTYLQMLRQNNKLENINAYRGTKDFFTSQCHYVYCLFRELGEDVESATFKLKLKKMRKQMISHYERIIKIQEIANNPDKRQEVEHMRLTNRILNFKNNQ